MTPAVLGSTAGQALGWALVHFVWQGALAAAILAVLNVLVGPRRSQLRSALASATLLAMIAAPLVTGAVVWRESARAEVPPPAPVSLFTRAPGADVASRVLPAPFDVRARLAATLPAIVALWGTGVLFFSARSVGGWALARGLKRSGSPLTSEPWEATLSRLAHRLRLFRRVSLRLSARIDVPMVVGWFRPVVLLPTATLAGMSAAQLELLLAHELAHLRRFDDLAGVFQTLAETLLFYHPAVWWVSHRMRVEREHCCDDAAVAACGDALSYARALTELETLRAATPRLALAATGGSLFERVARLLGEPAPRSSRWLAVLVAVSTAAAALAGATSITPRPALASPRSMAGEASRSEDPSAPPRASTEQAPPEAPARKTTRTTTTSAEKPAAASRPLPIERILELAEAGVTPEYVDGLAAEGYPDLSADQLLTLRHHGVSPEYVRALKAQGFTELSASNLVELRAAGVSGEFARGLKEAGLADLSMTGLLTLRMHGVSPEFVSSMKAVGHGEVSVPRLIALRSAGVTSEFVKEMGELGYAGPSGGVLIALRNHGVTPEYVRDLQALGYRGLSTSLLMELRNHGVTPEFAREMKKAAGANFSPEELIDLRDHGVRPELLRRLGGRPSSKEDP